MPNTESCSKCSKPLDTEGTPKWCKSCRAEYQRSYQGTKEGRAEAKGFARGARAMRDTLRDGFMRIGGGGFEYFEVAQIIDTSDPPKFEVEPD